MGGGERSSGYVMPMIPEEFKPYAKKIGETLSSAVDIFPFSTLFEYRPQRIVQMSPLERYIMANLIGLPFGIAYPVSYMNTMFLSPLSLVPSPTAPEFYLYSPEYGIFPWTIEPAVSGTSDSLSTLINLSRQISEMQKMLQEMQARQQEQPVYYSAW